MKTLQEYILDILFYLSYIKEHKFIKYAENTKRVKCTPMTCKDILNFINEKEKSIEFGAKSTCFTLIQI